MNEFLKLYFPKDIVNLISEMIHNMYKIEWQNRMCNVHKEYYQCVHNNDVELDSVITDFSLIWANNSLKKTSLIDILNHCDFATCSLTHRDTMWLSFQDIQHQNSKGLNRMIHRDEFYKKKRDEHHRLTHISNFKTNTSTMIQVHPNYTPFSYYLL